MIIVLKQDAPDVQVHEFCHELEGMGLQINDSKGSDTHILGLIGDTKAIAESWVLANPVVETCRRVSEPYKKANRKFHPDDSVIDVDGVKIGGGNFAVIAGPCSIESEEQITYCAQRVKAAGASLLRGGAFKPRTSPYSFQGMRSEGLDLLKLARRATGAPIVTEIMNTEHLPLFENVDLIQVGARNMQNFELLKAVGRQKKPVLLIGGLFQPTLKLHTVKQPLAKIFRSNRYDNGAVRIGSVSGIFTHTIDNQPSTLRRGIDNLSTRTHAKRIHASAIRRCIGQFI